MLVSIKNIKHIVLTINQFINYILKKIYIREFYCRSEMNSSLEHDFIQYEYSPEKKSQDDAIPEDQKELGMFD